MSSSLITKLTDLMSPARAVEAVTPNDSASIVDVKALYIGTTGDVTIDTPDLTNVIFSNVPAGFIFPVQATKVYLTGTTASNIVALQIGTSP